MAAIYDENGTLDINKLTVDIKEQLPTYARPQFIRILTKIDLTGIRLYINSILLPQVNKCILELYMFQLIKLLFKSRGSKFT